MTALLLAALLGQAGPAPERPPATPRPREAQATPPPAQVRTPSPPAPTRTPAPPPGTGGAPAEARAGPPEPPPRPPLSPEDEEVVRHLELLERLDFLRHAHVVDDGEVSEPRKPPGR